MSEEGGDSDKWVRRVGIQTEMGEEGGDSDRNG